MYGISYALKYKTPNEDAIEGDRQRFPEFIFAPDQAFSLRLKRGIGQGYELVRAGSTEISSLQLSKLNHPRSSDYRPVMLQDQFIDSGRQVIDRNG